MKVFPSILLSLLIAILLFSCNNDEKNKNSSQGTEEIIIDAKHQTALPYDSIFKEIDYIKLETTDENLIGQISQVIFIDSLIVVVDKENARTVNVFDQTGKFLYPIGTKGNGPGEYVDISHVTYNRLKDRLALYDKMQKRIINYNLKGEHLFTERPPFTLIYFEYLKNGGKAFYKGGTQDPLLGKLKDNPLYVTDSFNNPLYGDCYVYYKLNTFEYSSNSPLRTFDEMTYFSPDFSNVVYLVNDSMVAPKYHINIVENGMPPIDDNITDEMFQDYRNRYFIFNGDFIELDKFTYINIMTPKGYPFVLYSHKQKKTFFCNDQISHPIHPFLFNKAPKARYNENTVVFDVSAYFLLFNKKELYDNYEAHQGWLDVLFDELDEESNPILVLAHLNEEI